MVQQWYKKAVLLFRAIPLYIGEYHTLMPKSNHQLMNDIFF